MLLCDYELGRSTSFAAEMTKQRPVIVLGPRLHRQFDPVIVVPLSTLSPARPDDRQVRIAAGTYDFLRSDLDSWAKCEFVAAVAMERLEWLRRRATRVSPRLHESDFRTILRATVRALGASRLHE